jgi:glycosyltransferase involved in cell wall biosynthesis
MDIRGESALRADGTVFISGIEKEISDVVALGGSIYLKSDGSVECLMGLKKVTKKWQLLRGAQISKRKGLQDLLTLAERLGAPYRVVLVGLKGKVPPAVLAIPRTDSPRELAEIYTAADVFVNPTYEDNYPTVNLEAAACGTPVITYRTGGSVESVPQDRIVEKGDLRGLEAMIRRVCGV